MKAQRGSIAVILLAILALLAIGGGAYYEVQQKAASQVPVAHIACSIEADKAEYSLGDTIKLSWTSTGADYANIREIISPGQTTGRDISQLTEDPNEKLSASGSSDEVANGEGPQTVALTVYGQDGTKSECKTTFNVTYTSVNDTSQTSQVSVPGMSKYTDPDFGFSFWYPSGWRVGETDKQVGDYTGAGFMAGHPNENSFVKSLQISNGKYSILLSEFKSSDGIAAVCGKCYDRIYYDATAHRWMDFTGWTIEEGLAGKHTDPADVSIKTMGGLPILWHGIVALNTEDFIVADVDPNDRNDPTLSLLKTIVATNSTSTSDSIEMQKQVIDAEAAATGANIITNGPPSATIDSITEQNPSRSTGNPPLFVGGYKISGTYNNVGDMQLFIVPMTTVFASQSELNNTPTNGMFFDSRKWGGTPKTNPFASSGDYSYETYMLYMPEGQYMAELYTVPNNTNNGLFKLLATSTLQVHMPN